MDTVYRELFAKENFRDMSIVVIQLKIFSDYRCDYKKLFTNTPRFTKSVNVFFRKRFPIYDRFQVQCSLGTVVASLSKNFTDIAPVRLWPDLGKVLVHVCIQLFDFKDIRSYDSACV